MRWTRPKRRRNWSRPTRSHGRPRHREDAVAHAAAGRQFDGPSVVPQHVQHRAPPLPRAEHAVAGDAGPRAIGRGEQRIDRLTRDIVVDKGFR